MRAAFAAAVVGTLGLLAQPAWSADDDAREWIERMSESLATRNYVGLFTHATGRQSETMRIVHRVGKNGSTERLVSLDGSGREIVRTPQEVHVYMPDRKVVLVEPRTDEGSLAKALPVPSPQLDELYTLSVRDGNKILGRDVVVVDIRPKDAHRYGYRLWLDEETAMPLRTVVADGLGRPIEQISFTQIDLPRRIDPKDLEPDDRHRRVPAGPVGAACARAADDGRGLDADATAAWFPPGRKSHPDGAGRGAAGPAPDLLRRICVDLGFHRARQPLRSGSGAVVERRFGERVLDAGRRPRRDCGRRGATGDGARSGDLGGTRGPVDRRPPAAAPVR